MLGWIDNIIVSTNENDAIYQLIENWNYKMALSEISNPSVSMIIRYGSNVERLLRRITSPERCEDLMKKFELDGKLSEKLDFITNKENFESKIFIKTIEEIKELLITIIQEYKTRWWEWIESIQEIERNISTLDINSINAESINNLKWNFMSYFDTISWINLNKDEKKKIKDLWLKTYRVKTEDELQTMREMWLHQDRLICPHTANAFFAAEQYKEENSENRKSIVVSETASPWKFLASIATALTCENRDKMRETYEELRPKENTQEWKEELLKMIEEAYEKNGKDFDENMIPEDLRAIYRNWVRDYEVHSAKKFWEKTLDFVDDIWDMFPKQTEKLIEKEKAKK